MPTQKSEAGSLKLALALTATLVTSGSMLPAVAAERPDLSGTYNIATL